MAGRSRDGCRIEFAMTKRHYQIEEEAAIGDFL
jgi:hypothetical protein